MTERGLIEQCIASNQTLLDFKNKQFSLLCRTIKCGDLTKPVIEWSIDERMFWYTNRSILTLTEHLRYLKSIEKSPFFMSTQAYVDRSLENGRNTKVTQKEDEIRKKETFCDVKLSEPDVVIDDAKANVTDNIPDNDEDNIVKNCFPIFFKKSVSYTKME